MPSMYPNVGESSPTAQRVISLNVGGTLFTTSLHTLKSDPESILAGMTGYDDLQLIALKFHPIPCSKDPFAVNGDHYTSAPQLLSPCHIWIRSIALSSCSAQQRPYVPCAGYFSGAGLADRSIDAEGRFFIDRDPKVCHTCPHTMVQMQIYLCSPCSFRESACELNLKPRLVLSPARGMHAYACLLSIG